MRRMEYDGMYEGTVGGFTTFLSVVIALRSTGEPELMHSKLSVVQCFIYVRFQVVAIHFNSKSLRKIYS